MRISRAVPASWVQGSPTASTGQDLSLANTGGVPYSLVMVKDARIFGPR